MTQEKMKLMARMDTDYDTVLCRHNALVLEHAALLININALVEAVAWERECEDCGEWLSIAWWDANEFDLHEILDIIDAARAEVDRLIERME